MVEMQAKGVNGIGTGVGAGGGAHRGGGMTGVNGKVRGHGMVVSGFMLGGAGVQGQQGCVQSE